MSWSTVRYGWLLPAAGRRDAAGALYARLVAAVELRGDPARRGLACRRIERWLGVGPAAAVRIFRDALASEAREEADTAYFMRHPDRLAACFGDAPALAPEPGPVIYAGLHLGSPVLGYLHLCARVAPELALVARALDAANPLPAAKRRFAVRKIAWVEARAGRPFLPTDAASMLRVRAQLRGGKPLYVLADVPGDTVARSAACRLFGDSVRLASGLATLTRIADSTVQTLAVTRDVAGFTLHVGPRIAPHGGDGALAAVVEALAPFIRAHPDQWWMWPYLPAAFDSARA